MPPRTPLLRPDSYFAERGVSPARGLAVALLFGATVLAAVFGMGWVFTAKIDGTYAADNPARPPETFCDDPVAGDSTPAGCDEPREVQRNIDQPLREAIGQVAGTLVPVLPFALLLTAGLLHLGSWAAGGEGRFVETFAVTAWGMLPGALLMWVAVGVLALTFDPVTVDAGTDPAAFEDELLANLAPLEGAGTVTGAVAAVWSAVVWRFGLAEARDLGDAAAWGVAGAVAGLFFLLGL